MKFEIPFQQKIASGLFQMAEWKWRVGFLIEAPHEFFLSKKFHNEEVF